MSGTVIRRFATLALLASLAACEPGCDFKECESGTGCDEGRCALAHTVYDRLACGELRLQEAVQWADGGNYVYDQCMDCVDIARLELDESSGASLLRWQVKVLEGGTDYESNPIFSEGGVVCEATLLVVSVEDVEGFDPDRRQVLELALEDMVGECAWYPNELRLLVDLVTMVAVVNPSNERTLDVLMPWQEDGWYTIPLTHCALAQQDDDGFCPVACQSHFDYEVYRWSAPENANGFVCEL